MATGAVSDASDENRMLNVLISQTDTETGRHTDRHRHTER